MKPTATTIVAAQRGFYVTGIMFEDAAQALKDSHPDRRERLLIRSPIIAWRIDTHEKGTDGGFFSQVTAITPNGDECAHGDFSAIEYPDKRLDNGCNGFFNMTEFLESAVEASKKNGGSNEPL